MPTPRWSFWFELMRRVLSRPGALLRELNPTNVRTFFYALRHEPPKLILQNLQRLLRGEERLRLYSEQHLIENEQVQLFLERLQLYPTKLEVYGWVLPRGGSVQQITLEADGQFIGAVTLDRDRPDLKARFGPSSQHLGLQFLGARPPRVQAISLQIHLSGQPVLPITLPMPDEVERYRTHLLRTEDELPSVKAIRRFLRKHKKTLPHIGIRATHEQWTQLGLSRKTSPFPFPCLHLQAGKKVPPSIDYVVQLTPETWATAHLLWQVVYAIVQQEEAPALIYWDEDQRLSSGDRLHPHYKPAFSPDYLLSWNYIGYNFAGPASCMQQDPIHPLDICPHLPPTDHSRVIHIPGILTHSPHPGRRDPEWETAARIRFLRKHQPDTKCDAGLLPDTYRIRYPLAEKPSITILIPFRDRLKLLQQCLDSLQANTTYPNWQVLLINNQSSEPDTLHYLQSLQHNPRIRQFDYDAPFNYAALHNAAMEQVDTPYILLLNNDIEVIAPGWLEAMMEYAQQDRVGAVGAKLLYPDDTLQHAGVLVGIGGAADHAHKHLPADAPGYCNRANTVQNLSACTAACLLLRTDRYREAGGMDAGLFPVAFNDVDLCLQLRQQGYDIIYTPHATLYHHESVSRGTDITPEDKKRASREIRSFQKKWRTFLEQGDPYYHSHLAINSGHFSPT